MNIEEKLAWVAGLKVGDEVAFDWHGNGQGLRRFSIQRVTELASRSEPIWVVRVGMMWFDRLGTQPGSWFAEIMPVTDEIRERIERYDVDERLDSVKWDSVPTPVLRQVLEIVKDEKERRS